MNRTGKQILLVSACGATRTYEAQPEELDRLIIPSRMWKPNSAFQEQGNHFIYLERRFQRVKGPPTGFMPIFREVSEFS